MICESNPPSIEWIGGIAIFAFVFRAINIPSLSRASRDWYSKCLRPVVPGAPPGWAFGAAWSILYICIFVSAFLAWAYRCKFSKDSIYNATLAMFVINIIANQIWTALFFGAANFLLAFLDLAVIFFTALAYAILIFCAGSGVALTFAAWLMVPYLLWLLYAGYINAAAIYIQSKNKS